MHEGGGVPQLDIYLEFLVNKGIYQAEVRHLSCINFADNEVTWGGDSKYDIQVWCKQL